MDDDCLRSGQYSLLFFLSFLFLALSQLMPDYFISHVPQRYVSIGRVTKNSSVIKRNECAKYQMRVWLPPNYGSFSTNEADKRCCSLPGIFSTKGSFSNRPRHLSIKGKKRCVLFFSFFLSRLFFRELFFTDLAILP